MTVFEIIQQVRDEYGERNQISEDQIRRYLNIIQEVAFNRDMLAFMEYNQTLTAVSSQREYDFPIDPYCRKFVGVTQYDPRTILGLNPPPTPATYDVGDYGFDGSVDDPRIIYEQVYIDLWNRKFTFAEDPSDTATYYLVYWRGAPTINTPTDDSNLIIPREFHWTVMVQGALKLADNDIYSERAPEAVLEPILQPFWTFLEQATDPGNRQQLISRGHPG